MAKTMVKEEIQPFKTEEIEVPMLCSAKKWPCERKCKHRRLCSVIDCFLRVRKKLGCWEKLGAYCHVCKDLEICDRFARWWFK